MALDQVPKWRIVSLDQFRGYTVVGMLLVNFLGGFQVVPAILKHHNTYCSYADTIMPQFFFAVGFAYRLTFLRRLAEAGFWAATGAVLKRNLGLILLGFVLYHLDGSVKSWQQLEELGLDGFLAAAFRRELFQTLVHIAITSIWVLPVIAAGVTARVAFLVASAALHLGLSSWFYFDWAWKTPVIDGGQLGFLTWASPLLVGSLAARRDLSWSGHGACRVKDAGRGGCSHVRRIRPFLPGQCDRSTTLCASAFQPGGHALFDEPAHGFGFLSDICGGVLAGGVRSLRASLRQMGCAVPPLSRVRTKCPGCVHHSSAGLGGRQAISAQRRALVVRYGRSGSLSGDLHAL